MTMQAPPDTSSDPMLQKLVELQTGLTATVGTRTLSITRVYENPPDFGSLIEDRSIVNMWSMESNFKANTIFEYWNLDWLLKLGSAFVGDERSRLWEEARKFRDAWFQVIAQHPLLDRAGGATSFNAHRVYIAEDSDPRIRAYAFNAGPGSVSLVAEMRTRRPVELIPDC